MGATSSPSDIRPAQNAVVACDSRGLITSFNESAERLFRRHAAEAVGKPLSILMPERFRDAHRAGFEKFAKGGQSRLIGRTVEFAGLRADGGEFPIELSLAATAAGSEFRFTAVIRDISERVELQEARRRLQELQDIVIRVMGHDLKAPIAVVQGYLGVALKELADLPEGPSREAARRAIAKAGEAAASMFVVLANARAVSRLTVAEGAPAPTAVVDAAKLVRQAADGLRPLAEAKGHALDVRVPAELKVALPPAFDSVVANLVSNAIKYTPEGGLIAVTLWSDANAVKLEVEDTGPGIPAAVRPRLFRRFERLSPDPSKEGHGLGLSIVASLVELADGRVSVHERGDGRPGSVFRVEIPLRQPAPPAAA